MDCVRCVQIHGPGCPASYTDAKGKAICVFCSDGISCPTQIRLLKQIRGPHHNPVQFAVAHAHEVTAAAAARNSVNRPDVTTLESKHDGVARDLEMQAAREAEKHQSQSQEEKNMATSTTPAPTSATSTDTIVKLCKMQGCKRQLGALNQSGFCRDHRPHTKTKTNGAGNGHNGGTRHYVHHARDARLQAARESAAAVKPNGQSAHGNGIGEDTVRSLGASRIEERLQLLLTSVPLDALVKLIPPEDQRKIVTAWLMGTVA
jgi:hypothetical protein